MNLKAIIPSGQTEITVNGLHQWDYGRKLEIHSNELPAIVEVHFACSGMDEAVVRSCSVTDGVATADIPDHCIEQTTPIVAWVYCIDDTSGYTERTIIMPIIARTKPAPSPTLPTRVSDKYTELITAVNEQIGALQDGTVIAAKATEADHATTADSATTAGTAGHATTADSATTAGTAGHATTADSATTAGTAGHATTAEHATTATQLTYTVVAQGEWNVGDTIAETSILKPNTKYIIKMGEACYDCETDSLANKLYFGETLGDLSGVTLLGGAVIDNEGSLVYEFYNLLMISKSGTITDVVAVTNSTPAITHIIECEARPTTEEASE